MPIAVALGENDLIIIHATGAITYADGQRAIDDILAFGRQGEERNVLIDGRGVTTAPSTGELRALARDLKPLIDRGLGAMGIVTDTAFVYGVARMFAVFAEVFGLKVRAFRNMDDATMWLATQPARI